MTDPYEILLSRRYGEVRYTLATERSGNMGNVLAKLGLKPEPNSLVEHNHESAFAILRELLWKDMAYEDECMPRERAESLAQDFFQQHSSQGSQYFSNGNWSAKESWNPLTESTFDAGIIIKNPQNVYACIWFQDED